MHILQQMILTILIATLVAFVVVRAQISGKSGEIYRASMENTSRNNLALFPLQSMKIQTADVDEAHLIHIQISIGYEKTNAMLGQELKIRQESIEEAVTRLLETKLSDEIRDLDKKEALKPVIKAMINRLLKKGAVQEIYYMEFIVG